MGNRLSQIATRTGDNGTTGLIVGAAGGALIGRAIDASDAERRRIAAEVHVSSAHRTPERTGKLAREAAGRGAAITGVKRREKAGGGGADGRAAIFLYDQCHSNFL